MFLHAFVILPWKGGGLCIMSFPVWLPGPMFLPRESLSLVPCSFWGVVSVGGSLSEVGSLSGVRGLCQEEGVSVYGVSVRRGISVRSGVSVFPHHTVDERVVRILLEYSLSFLSYLTSQKKKSKEFYLLSWHFGIYFPLKGSTLF